MRTLIQSGAAMEYIVHGIGKGQPGIKRNLSIVDTLLIAKTW